MNLLPQTTFAILAKIVVYGTPWTKGYRQHTPLTAGAYQIENSIDDCSYVNRARPSAMLGPWQQRVDKFPLPIRQVTGLRWHGYSFPIKREKPSLSERNTYANVSQ